MESIILWCTCPYFGVSTSERPWACLTTSSMLMRYTADGHPVAFTANAPLPCPLMSFLMYNASVGVCPSWMLAHLQVGAN